MEDTSEKGHQTPGGKPISRRDFLKASGAALGGLFLSSFLPDSNGNPFAGNLATRVVTSIFAEQDSDEAEDTLSLIQRETGETQNPSYQPYLEILKDGISEFQSNNPEITVVWNRDGKYVGDYETSEFLLRPITKKEVPDFYPNRDKYIGKSLLIFIQDVASGGDPSVPYEVFYNRLPEEIRNVINTVNTNMVAFPGTVLYAKFYPEQGNVFSHEDITKYYEQVKSDLEALYFQDEKHRVLPLSKLVAYFLGKNEGSLAPALGDMAGFAKYLIRGDDTSQSVEQIDWFRIHIQDQLNEDFSLNNIASLDNLPDNIKNPIKSIWGLLYHVPSLVYLLQYISPDLVRLATMYEYISHNHEAEAYKLKVDIKFMDGLNTISNYLQSFARQSK